MTKKQYRVLYQFVTAYSFFALLPFAEKSGGACNSGPALAALALILGLFAVCSLVIYLNLFGKKKKYSALLNKILSITVCLVWSGLTISAAKDNLKYGLLFTLPYLCFGLFQVMYVFRQKEIKKPE
jgi:hypothetical protein